MNRMQTRRAGFTILELVVVLAILIILGALTLPSLFSLRGNAYQKAGVDQLRASIADARGLAMSESVPYRLAASKDGKRLRTAPDTADFATMAVPTGRSSGAKSMEVAPESVTYEVESGNDEGADQAGEDDWLTIAIFLPNGTCRQTQSVVAVHEANFPPIRVLLRGLTGTATILQPESSDGGMK